MIGAALGKYALYALGAVLLVGGFYWHAYSKGVEHERTRIQIEAARQAERDRKLREENDGKVRNLDDARALECLRNPAGCR